MDPIFLTFIKNLPSKEQLIYLLIRSYEKDLNGVNDQCSLTLIRDIYEPQIEALISNRPKKIEPKENRPLEKDPFEDKLGAWASDFSEAEIDRLLLEN
jgi:hypothetical protein